eukprot:m.168069 g.168069  ORF g.168069 m.168069 type:complete len:351 (-) comp31490_c0_seq1:71-1123(-)
MVDVNILKNGTEIHNLTPVLFDFPQMCLNNTDPTPPDPSRIHYGTIILLACISAITFASIIAWRYNHVLVIHRRVRTRTVSNTNWIVYFIAAGVENGLHLCRILTWELNNDVLNFSLFYAQLFASGLSAILLCLALDYQRRYRSHNPPSVPTGFSVPPTNGSFPDSKFLIQSVNGQGGSLESGNNNRSVCSGAMAILLQSGVYCGLLIVEIVFKYGGGNSDLSDLVLKWLFMASIWLMQITLVLLAVVIITNVDDDGPRGRGKGLLAFATVLSVSCHALPTGVWQAVLPAGCVWDVLSWGDLLDALTFVTYIFYYLFMREEYQRNKETCIYSTVSQIQQAQLHSWQKRQP